MARASGRPVQAAIIARIVAATGVPCQVAGGLRDAGCGGHRPRRPAPTAPSSAARSSVTRPSARTLVERHGPDAIVAAIDVRDGRALGDGWVAGATGTPALDLITTLAGHGIRWFAVTAIARDGLLGGSRPRAARTGAGAAPGARIDRQRGRQHARRHRGAARRAATPAAILGRALYEGIDRAPGGAQSLSG